MEREFLDRGLQGSGRMRGPRISVARGLIVCCVFMALSVHVFAGAVSMPGKDEIPPDTPPDVRKLIVALYSQDAVERGKSAALLGFGGPRSARAVPFLIGILGDDTKLKWIGSSLYEGPMPYPGILTSPGDEARKALARIGRSSVEPLIQVLKDPNPKVCTRAVEALKTISGKDLGTDGTVWRNWWEAAKEHMEKENVKRMEFQ